MRLWAPLLSLLVACSGPARNTPPPPLPPKVEAPASDARHPERGLSRAPSSAEAALIRELMLETERLRALKFRATVHVRIQDRSAMRAYVDTALDEAALIKARRRYVALGLIDPGLDVRELIAELMEEELVGYYDPKQKLLAVRADVADALAQPQRAARRALEWRATVVHELVHALQDQHLGLSEAMEQTRTTDQENVFGAIVEGDATLTMLAYTAERQGLSLDTLVTDPAGLRRSLYDQALQAGGRLAAAPAIVREPLLFRYREGALFAARSFAQGGWERVNEAHRHPPASTLALRGETRTESADQPLDLTALSPAGCEVADRDVLGSLEVGAALSELGLPGVEVAKAWRGDAYAVLACAGSDASLWFLRFSTLALARRVRAALLRPQATGDTTRVITQQGAALMVARRLEAATRPLLESSFRAWASMLR